IVIIVLILLTWPFAILISHFARKRRERREKVESERAGSTPAPVGPGRGSGGLGNYEELTRITEETVRWLRGTRLGMGKSGDVIYRLPWFLVAGPPDSGKTSLLLSAGLDFHALPSQRRADQSIIRPTHDLEFRVTDSAVFLDTSGRYLTE